MAFDAQGRGGASGNDDLYEILGLSPDAPADEVDAAYHRLLNGLTTTSGNSPAAVENLRRRRIRLANAYAVLADEEQRAAYDARMGLQKTAQPPPLAVTTPTTSLPPMAMPEVRPRTEVPPMPMPQVTPRTEVPPMPMPEIQRPAPVTRPPKSGTLASAVSPPLPAEPLANPVVSGEDVEELRVAAPAEPLVVAPTAAETLPEIDVPPVEAAAEEETAEAESDVLPEAEEEEEDASPVDNTPAPWEDQTRSATVYPTIRPRPAERQPGPAAPAPRAVGGVSLPSRKVAEATPLPAPRSRFATVDAPPRPLSDADEADQPGSRVRPAARSAPAPARQRAAAPVRRTPRKSRTNFWQTLFYGSMAVILVIGTFGGIASSIFTPLGTTAAPTTVSGTADQIDAQAAALLAAGNYSQAITLYNQALTANNGTDAKALLGLAKAYFYKTPSEPDIAREYLARVFTAAGGTNSPEGQEALQLLGTIGLPGSPGAGTPGAGTPGAAGTPNGTPGAGTTPLPTTSGAASSTPLPATTGATGSTPLPATSGATGSTPLPATQPVPATNAALPPGGAPAAGTSSPNK